MAEYNNENEHECSSDCCSCGCGDEGTDIISLTDEEGVTTDFAVVGMVEYNNATYTALIEAEHIEDDECEFIILKDEEDEDGNVSLITIEDEDEFNEVLKMFEESFDDDGLYEFGENEEDIDEEQ